MGFYEEGKPVSDLITFVIKPDAATVRVQLAIESYKGRAKTSKFCLLERYFYVDNPFDVDWNGKCYGLLVVKTFTSKKEALKYFDTTKPSQYSIAIKNNH